MSKISRWVVGVEDPIAIRKRVVFRPVAASDTIKVGSVVCFNSDATSDAEERSTNPASAHFGSDGNETTYAEGVQSYIGRLLIVESPSEDNLYDGYGIVASLGPEAGGDGDTIEIYVPNGAVVPVWTNVNCVRGTTVLGPGSGSYIMQQDTGDGDPLGCAIAMETVDRSNVNGLVWARISPIGQVFSGFGGFFQPTEKRNGRTYGFVINGDKFFQGVAGAQEYLVHLEGGKDVVASGDCYGGILKLSGTNGVDQPTSYIWRGLNISANSDGILGTLENFIGVKNDEGTATTVVALTLRNENYGTNTGSGTVFGGLDVLLTPEGTMAEKSFGIRVRNNNNSLATAVDAVLEVSETGVNTGFTNFLKVPTAADCGITAATVEAAHVLGFDGDGTAVKIPVSIGGVTYYILAGTATALVADA